MGERVNSDSRTCQGEKLAMRLWHGAMMVQCGGERGLGKPQPGCSTNVVKRSRPFVRSLFTSCSMFFLQKLSVWKHSGVRFVVCNLDLHQGHFDVVFSQECFLEIAHLRNSPKKCSPRVLSQHKTREGLRFSWSVQ